MAATTKFTQPKIPKSWPRWNLRCDHTRNVPGPRHGNRCGNQARLGDTRCYRHGSNGKRALHAWRRYLTYVATGGTTYRDMVSEHTTRSLARYFLKPEEHHEASITTEDKVLAATYLMTSAACLTAKQDAIEVVGPMVDDDYTLAAQVVAELERHGLIVHTW